MIVLVCGDRDFGDTCGLVYGTPLWNERFAQYQSVHETLSELLSLQGPTQFHIISGAARGVDTAAVGWARNNLDLATYREYPADWDRYKKAAGHIRNAQMLKEGKPDLVIAFLKEGSRGTRDMVQRATHAGVRTIIIDI